MQAAFSPHHPTGFLVIALIAFLVVIAVLPAIDYLFAAAAQPVNA